MAPELVTVGHSTRPIGDFLDLLARHGVRRLADVRTTPRSRRHPHFAAEALAASLVERGIAYRHVPALGGRRRARPDSPNLGWRDASFRGYADHMASPAFRAGLAELLGWADAAGATALMCAEAVPWRCHRWLIADALVAGGVPVAHLIGPAPPRPHRLSSFARVEDGRPVYPSQGDLLT